MFTHSANHLRKGLILSSSTAAGCLHDHHTVSFTAT
jgi:hypothetical protein